MLCIITRDTRFTETHEHLTILIQLNDLVPHPALRPGLSSGITLRRALGNPEVPVSVHIKSVRPGKKTCANRLDRTPLAIQLVDWVQVRPGTLIGPTSLGDPDVFAIRIRLYAGNYSHATPTGQLSPVVNDLIRIGLCSREPRVNKQPEKHYAQQNSRLLCGFALISSIRIL